jgi:RHS repeat-associated protein
MSSQQARTITRPLAEIYGRHSGYGFAGLGVNMAIGNFTQTATDLAFPGALLGLLDWTRTYNSLSQTTGALGDGWTTAFSARLVLSAQGLLHHAAGPVTFFDDDGRVLTFTPGAAGTFVTPQDLDASLARNPDGSFVLAFNNGQQWDFDSTGRLTSRSAEGQQVALTYDSAGRLMQAAHSSGRQLALTYGAAGQLASLAADDGRTVSYGYTADGVLQSVTSPAGGQATFETTGGRLSRITDADGCQVVANTFDSSGRVATQELPGGSTADFAYDGATGVATVTYGPDGGTVTLQADSAGRMTKVTDPGGNSASFGYDANGRLLSATTPGGAQIAQTYDTAGNLLSSTLAGDTWNWTFDDASRVTTATGPAGDMTGYSYAGDSHLPAQIVGPDGGVTSFAVVNGLITQQTDPDGNSFAFGYDTAGNLVSITDPLGDVTRNEYDQVGKLIQTTRPSGATTSYAYNAAGLLVSQTDPTGATTSFRYSAAGRLQASTDPTGAQTSYAYNAAGVLTSVTDPLGNTTAYTSDPFGNPATVTNPDGEVTQYAYNALGRLTSVTSATGTVTGFTYDPDGNSITRQGPAGTTSGTYDARGNLLSATDPAGGVMRYTYDAAARLISATDADGGTWGYGYDAAGNLVTTTDPVGAVTTQLHTPAGRLAAVIDPLGRRTSYAYDARGQLTTVTDPQGGTTAYDHDADGHRISATTPAGLTTSYAYDPAGRVIASTDPRGWITRSVYNARGQQTLLITPSGSATGYRYDAASHLTEVTDPNGGTTEFVYDSAGRLTQVTDPKGSTIRYGYDADGRLTSITDPLGRTTQRAYDTAGNLITVTDPSGHAVHMEYDKDGRLIQKSAEGTVDVTFSYDAAGRRISMTDATGTTHYAYDAAGRLVTVTSPDGAAVTAGYDAAGHRTSLTYPDGLQVTFGYDLNGRLTALHDPRAGDAAYALDPDGRLLTEQFPGRYARRYHYDGGLLRHFSVIRDGRPVSRTSFTHDPDGRIASQCDKSGHVDYEYDPCGQLVRVAEHDEATARPGAPGPGAHRGQHRPGDVTRPAELRLAYDAAGNRTGVHQHGRQTGYRYDAADQLVDLATDGHHTEFRYDSAGRLTEEHEGDRHRVISYDGFGQPATVIRSEAGRTERAQATFDGDGQLAALVLTASRDRDDEEHTATVRYLWGTVGQIPQILAQRVDTESHDVGRLSAEFSYGYGRAFASGEHGAAAFHHDAFGSAVRTEDTSPWVQASRYDAFGLPRDADLSTDDRERRRVPELPKFGYRGEQALGPVINLRARAYDTRLGRFTTRDPVIAPMTSGAAANPYTYAANDPLNVTDPLGTVIVAMGGGNLQSPAPERHDAVHHVTGALHASTQTVPNPPGTGRTGSCTLYTGPFNTTAPFGLEHEDYLSESDTQKLIYYLELPTAFVGTVTSDALSIAGVILAAAAAGTVVSALGAILVALFAYFGEWDTVGHLLSLIDERGGHRGITFTYLLNPLALPPGLSPVPDLPPTLPVTLHSSGSILGGTPIPYVWYQPASLPANLCAPPMLRPTPVPAPPTAFGA